MATPFDVMFGLPSLSGRVKVFGEDVTRTRLFQDKFFRFGRQLRTRDGSVKWDEVTMSRGLAPFAGLRGRFKNKAELGRTERTSHVAVIKRSVELNPERLYFQRESGELDPNAEAYVEEEMEDLATEVGNSIEYLAAEALRGTVTINAANVPDTTQVFTLTFSPNTYSKSAGWGTAGTKIISSEIPALKTDCEQNSGMSPGQVICTNTVEGYLNLNTETIAILGDGDVKTGMLRTAGTMRGPLFNGFRIGGMDWLAYEGGYVPSGGSFTKYLPTADEAIVLPDDSQLGGVLGYALGQGLVPQGLLGPASEAACLIAPAEPGWFSYARLVGDAPTVKLFVGWAGLLLPTRPDAICVADLD